MTDVLIYGINGKMGKAVYAAAENRRDVNVVCGADKRVLGNFDCPVYQNLNQVSERVDAIIDFSSSSSLDDILSYAAEYGCALVLATTGYTRAQIDGIREISKIVPVYFSPNASLGANAVMKILPQLKKLLAPFDVCITETHGARKTDKPSGTAIAIKKILDENGSDTEIHSLRGGDVPGIHEITFLGEYERVTVTHEAFSRRAFASGALDACVKLVSLPPSLYVNLN
ncbi:MAG: hypothetical protein J6Z34_03050 [Clostridia bacterium]|nr:hypothetical protein [Clostridia bacterium]